MRLVLGLGLALALSACIAAPCIGQDPHTTISWLDGGLVSKTPGLDWDAAATLPMPAGLPQEGAALLTISHHGSGLELRAHNLTHARVMSTPEPNATGIRERVLRLVENATHAAPAQQEAWADEFAKVTEVPFEGMQETSQRHIVHIPIPALGIQAWWQREPHEKQDAKDSWGSRHWHVGGSTSWEVKTEERVLRGDGDGHAVLFGHGLVHVSVEGRHLSDPQMREIAASWVGPLGLQVPEDAVIERACG